MNKNKTLEEMTPNYEAVKRAMGYYEEKEKVQRLADTWIDEMIEAGLNPDQMLEVIQSAREKYQELVKTNGRSSQPTKTNQNEQTTNPNPHTAFKTRI